MSKSKLDKLTDFNDNKNLKYERDLYSPIKQWDYSPLQDNYSNLTDQKTNKIGSKTTGKKSKKNAMSESSSENYLDNVELVKRETLESIAFVEATIQDYDENCTTSNLKSLDKKINELSKENQSLKTDIEVYQE